eukprot:3053002-Prymnesium_polylepis.2
MPAPDEASLENERVKLEALFESKVHKMPDYVRKLVGGFEFRVYRFECKLVLVGLPVFFDPPGSEPQLVFGLMSSFVIFGAYSYWQPYVDALDDRLPTLCQAQIFFALLAAVVNASTPGCGKLIPWVSCSLALPTLLILNLNLYVHGARPMCAPARAVRAACPRSATSHETET